VVRNSFSAVVISSVRGKLNPGGWRIAIGFVQYTMFLLLKEQPMSPLQVQKKRYQFFKFLHCLCLSAEG
jgi:hypothetical protein